MLDIINNTMNTKAQYYQNNLQSPEKTAVGKNGKAKSSVQEVAVANCGKEPEELAVFQLNELQKINAHLHKALEDRSKKLLEVVATNSKFMSIIAHDLRSPFSSIIGALELLKSSLDDFSIYEIEKYISIASKSAINTLDLLDNLLMWTVSQNKEKNFLPVRINLLELVDYEIESIKASATQKQIRLFHSIVPDLFIRADFQMVKTIFRNLINNAIKYTDTGGDIHIEALVFNRFVEISVKDNGIGISPDFRKGIFQDGPVHTTAGTWNEQGTGLGLMLCKEFVEIHGGDIRVESEPGTGSSFIFTLPHIT